MTNETLYSRHGDATVGTNFLNMRATLLLSVSYALYAKSAGPVNGGGTGDYSTRILARRLVLSFFASIHPENDKSK